MFAFVQILTALAKLARLPGLQSPVLFQKQLEASRSRQACQLNLARRYARSFLLTYANRGLVANGVLQLHHLTHSAPLDYLTDAATLLQSLSVTGFARRHFALTSFEFLPIPRFWVECCNTIGWPLRHWHALNDGGWLIRSEA